MKTAEMWRTQRGTAATKIFGYLPQRRKDRKENPPFIPLSQRGKEGDFAQVASH
jgi:hypothetical protein